MQCFLHSIDFLSFFYGTKKELEIIELLTVTNICRNATCNVREGDSLARNRRYYFADPINARATYVNTRCGFFIDTSANYFAVHSTCTSEIDRRAKSMDFAFLSDRRVTQKQRRYANAFYNRPANCLVCRAKCITSVLCITIAKRCVRLYRVVQFC